jgi:hypothetical protein
MLYTYSQALSGLTYSVDSLDVSPGVDQLDSAPSGPGSMSQYLAVPRAYESLLPYAKKIVKGARTPGAEAIDLETWFSQGNRFTYSLNVTGPPGAAGVKYFLTTSMTGYCQQFAFAMAVLARLLGIPSRVVVGYTAGTPTGHGNYVVKTSDAHAWPELYFRGLGWLRMEPTPQGTAIGQGTAKPPPYSASSLGGGTGTGGGTSQTSGGTQGSQGHKLTRITPVGGPGGVSLSTGAAARNRQGAGDAGALLITLAALLALGLVTPRAVRSLTRRRRWLAAREDAARAHAAWLELLDDLTDFGVRSAPGETPRTVAKRLATQLRLTPSDRAALTRITQAEERASYAPQPGPAGTLRADVTAVRGAISASVPRSARWRARLLPASAAERMRASMSHALDAFGWLEVATTRIRGRLPRPRPADQG